MAFSVWKSISNLKLLMGFEVQIHLFHLFLVYWDVCVYFGFDICNHNMKPFDKRERQALNL